MNHELICKKLSCLTNQFCLAKDFFFIISQMVRHFSPNTTGVLSKSESGNLFEICLVKKRNCRSDFFCLLVEKKSVERNIFQKEIRSLHSTVGKKINKKVLSIHLHLGGIQQLHCNPLQGQYRVEFTTQGKPCFHYRWVCSVVNIKVVHSGFEFYFFGTK